MEELDSILDLLLRVGGRSVRGLGWGKKRFRSWERGKWEGGYRSGGGWIVEIRGTQFKG
jgi:hypothetical protein